MCRFPLFVFLGCILSLSVSAGTIIKTTAGSSSGPDSHLAGGFFSTINQSITTMGDASTSINFTNELSLIFTDIASGSGASLSISGIQLVADAFFPFGGGPVVGQATTGGSFSVFDDSDALLLSGIIDEGVFLGSIGFSAGSFQSTNALTYTGGSAVPHLISNEGSISISLTEIKSGMADGFLVVGNSLSPFDANITAQFDTKPVPEPATALMFSSILLFGSLARSIRKRRYGISRS